MKRIIRGMFAVFAALALMFINIGPFAISVLATDDSGTWKTPPSWNTEPAWKTPPKWEGPKWKSSGWKTQPSWNTAPNWQSPGWNTQPSWKTQPNWQSPGWESQPNWQSPGWENQPSWENQPNWQSPGWENQPPWENQPNWNDPNWNGPNWNNPNSNQKPDPNSNGTNNNDPTSPDGLQPNVPGDPNSPIPPDDKNNPLKEDQTNTQKDSETETSNKGKNNKSEDDSADPFWKFDDYKPKDAIDFAFKEVVGGNIELIDDYLRSGDLTLSDYLKSKGKIGYAGFKVFTKGDPTADALHDGIDVAQKSKELYDYYKSYKEIKKVDDLRKAGDLLEYAQKSRELYETGKSFSTGNAVVSAITMPLTIWDTVDNVKKLNNAKTADEKTDAKWDLAENAGSLLTGAAPFVAMIPGAQPIAAGMAIVGTGISLVCAGRKLWKNRKEIGENVAKKAKKVGKWFKSLFKG